MLIALAETKSCDIVLFEVSQTIAGYFIMKYLEESPGSTGQGAR
jgi:hypothetical protein